MKKTIIHIIALALHVSILFYGGVVIYLAHINHWVSSWALSSTHETLLLAFVVVSIVTGAVAVFFPRLRKGSHPPLQGAEVISSPLFFDFTQVTTEIQTLTIVRMALAEAVAIFGMALSFITQSPTWILPFGAASLLLQVLVGPFGRMLRGS